MTYFLVNEHFPAEFCTKLAPYGTVLLVPPFAALDFPVNAHPDMLAVNVCGTLFVHEENTALCALLAEHKIPFRTVSAKAGKTYPADVALNLFTLKKRVVRASTRSPIEVSTVNRQSHTASLKLSISHDIKKRVVRASTRSPIEISTVNRQSQTASLKLSISHDIKNWLFANVKYASGEVLAFARENGYEVVNLKQGYSKCSTMPVGDALVTADTGIYKAALAHGVDALLISAGHVGIEKYDTGFIGGASGALCAGKVCVFGNLNSHPDGKKIRAFAYAQGVEVLNLGECPLFDYGGIVRIDI